MRSINFETVCNWKLLKPNSVIMIDNASLSFEKRGQFSSLKMEKITASILVKRK